MKLQGKRARLGGVLAAAVAALAMLALPGLASSHEHHHELAGNAGTVQSFDAETGVLVIALTEGGTVSGLVTPGTRIRCGEDHGHRHGLDSRRHGGAMASHDGSGDEHEGRGPGDEGSGRGEEPGEDAPGHDGTPPGSGEEPGQGAEHADRCAGEDLVAGATVRVAELVLLDGKAVYAFVGLEQPAAEEAPAG
ncbi:MAG TPA: hypothetical protein VGH58_10990 [Solirubrobacterales bacterium]